MTTKLSSMTQPSPKRITLAIDFDGVIRDFDTGEMVPDAKRALEWLEKRGIKIVISTSCKNGLDFVREWLREHDMNYEVTDKKVAATCYIDDRAIRFTNWKDVTSYF